MPVPAERQGKEQPGSARESGQGNGGEQPSVHERFRARLMEERKGSTPESDKEKPEPRKPKAQTPPDDPDEDERDEELEEADDDDDSDERESDADPDGDEGDEEPDDEEDRVEALTVGDRQYTAEDIVNLEKQVREYDADYRRKTQVMARHRQEFQARGEEYTQIGSFFENLTRVNLQNLEAVNPETLDQNQFAAWRQQVQAARQGASQLMQMLGQVRKKVSEDREKFLDAQAAESAEVLKAEFKGRWGNEFYGKLRDFAGREGLYDAKEFVDITDWRVMKGLVALYDASEAKKIASGKTGKTPGKERDERKPNRRQLQRARRDSKTGKFQSTKDAVRSSPNARGDGTLHSHFMDRLGREARGKR
jgi:hypothetical protein